MTWFQVEDDPGVPNGICRTCSEAAFSAMHFTQLCKSSVEHWESATSYFTNLHPPTADDKAYYIIYTADNKTIVRDQVERVDSTQKALRRLKRFQATKKAKKVKKLQSKKLQSTPLKCKCLDCGKAFSDPQFLNSHLRNTLKRACLKCGLVMAKSKLPSHLANAHKTEVFHCEICYKCYEDPNEVLKHKMDIHDMRLYQCLVCGNGFVTERALSAHMYAHSLFHCKSCSLSFENRKCYKYHQNLCDSTKTINKPAGQFMCDHCGLKYTKKPSLRIHIIQKHLNVLPYSCHTCGKRTSTIAHLRSHEAVHTESRKIFLCYCGAKFRTELGYNLHQRIHTGERPYECEECGDKFLSASRRLDHIKRRHRSSKDMPHGCDKCACRFVRPFELKKHYLAVHHAQINVLPAKRGIKRPNEFPKSTI